MTIGISKTLEMIAAVQDLSIKAIEVVKVPTVSRLFSLFPAILADLTIFSKDASAVLPELADLDANEVGQLGAAAYTLVQAILVALKD